MSIHTFTRRPVRRLKFDNKLQNSFVVNKYAFTFMIVFCMFTGMYLGFTVQAAAVYSACSIDKKWSWGSFIFERVLEVDCRVHEKVR